MCVCQYNSLVLCDEVVREGATNAARRVQDSGQKTRNKPPPRSGAKGAPEGRKFEGGSRRRGESKHPPRGAPPLGAGVLQGAPSLFEGGRALARAPGARHPAPPRAGRRTNREGRRGRAQGGPHAAPLRAATEQSEVQSCRRSGQGRRRRSLYPCPDRRSSRVLRRAPLEGWEGRPPTAERITPGR